MALVLGMLGAPARAQIVSVGDQGFGCTSIPAAGGTHVITLSFGAGVAVGQTAILAASTTANLTVVSVTDSVGNTWSGDMSFAPAAMRTFLYSSRATTLIPNGGTVTITYTNATGVSQTSCGTVTAFSGLQTTPGYIDQVGSNSGSGTAISVSTSAPTTSPNELVFSVVTVTNPSSFTPAAGSQGSFAGISGSFGEYPFYKIVASTGTQTNTGTFISSTPWQAIIATYKAAVVPVELQRFRAD
jgi:hypothetical protein